MVFQKTGKYCLKMDFTGFAQLVMLLIRVKLIQNHVYEFINKKIGVVVVARI